MKRALLALLLVAGSGCTRQVEVLTGPGGSGGGSPSTCGLPSAAFCDSFDTESAGGRGSPLDAQRWQVTRFTTQGNPPQGFSQAWPPGTGFGCGTARPGVVPPADIFFCDQTLRDVVNSTNGFALHGFSPRQPFDFAGRTGTIAFDLGGRVQTRSGWWPEIWLTEDPTPGPQAGDPGGPTVRRGLGIVLAGEVTCGQPQTRTAVSLIYVMNDYGATAELGAADFGVVECFEVEDDLLNHFELRISKTLVELMLTPPGGAARKVLSAAVSLPFERGFLHLEQVHSGAAANGGETTHTFAWDNVGFDGPVLAKWSASEAPDSLLPISSPLVPAGSMDTGYPLFTVPLALTLRGVARQGHTEAAITLTTVYFASPNTLRLRLNGGSTIDVADPLPSAPVLWRQLQVPVPLSLLREGDNTLEISLAAMAEFAHLANVDLLLR